MAVDPEYVHDAGPYGLAAERFLDWHLLKKRSRAAVLRFNGTFQFGDTYVHDMKHISNEARRNHNA